MSRACMYSSQLYISFILYRDVWLFVVSWQNDYLQINHPRYTLTYTHTHSLQTLVCLVFYYYFCCAISYLRTQFPIRFWSQLFNVLWYNILPRDQSVVTELKPLKHLRYICQLWMGFIHYKIKVKVGAWFLYKLPGEEERFFFCQLSVFFLFFCSLLFYMRVFELRAILVNCKAQLSSFFIVFFLLFLKVSNLKQWDFVRVCSIVTKGDKIAFSFSWHWIIQWVFVTFTSLGKNCGNCLIKSFFLVSRTTQPPLTINNVYCIIQLGSWLFVSLKWMLFKVCFSKLNLNDNFKAIDTNVFFP